PPLGPPTQNALDATERRPFTARKAHRMVRPYRERGDATAASPASRPPAGDPETVGARLCPALHEPERRGAEGGRMARDAGLRDRECGSSAPDRGRPVPGLRGPRPDRGRRTRVTARRVARARPPRAQSVRGARP